MNNVYLKFAKIKENAIIPSKKEEDSGFDIYSCLEKDWFINAHTTRLVPTGIACEFPKNWTLLLEERGSTGSKGVKRSAGVIDSGFRNEIFIALTNASYKTVVISVNINKTKERLIRLKEKQLKDEHGAEYNATKYDFNKFIEKNYIIYPSTKAIAQGLLLYTPHVEVQEVKYEELSNSERGLGMLGSSGK